MSVIWFYGPSNVGKSLAAHEIATRLNENDDLYCGVLDCFDNVLSCREVLRIISKNPYILPENIDEKQNKYKKLIIVTRLSPWVLYKKNIFLLRKLISLINVFYINKPGTILNVIDKDNMRILRKSSYQRLIKNI